MKAFLFYLFIILAGGCFGYRAFAKTDSLWLVFSLPVGIFFLSCAALIVWSALWDVNKREPHP